MPRARLSTTRSGEAAPTPSASTSTTPTTAATTAIIRSLVVMVALLSVLPYSAHCRAVSNDTATIIKHIESRREAADQRDRPLPKNSQQRQQALPSTSSHRTPVALPSPHQSPITPPPHLVVMLTDDLGFNAPGYRNPDLITPTLDRLATKEGVILEQFYTYKYCAPTRGSFLTGRMPYKLESPQRNFIPWYGRYGTHLGYTMLPAKLKQAGYQSHHIGKWHQGFWRDAYTPISRGFDTTFSFLVGGEDHWTQDAQWGTKHCNVTPHDLWDNGKPAIGRTGTGPGDLEHYNAYTFTARAVELIHEHAAATTASAASVASATSSASGGGSSSSVDTTHHSAFATATATATATASPPPPPRPPAPFFLYFALHNTHGPIEAPRRFIDMYNFSLPLRNTFDAMVSVVDESVANVTRALRETGMWNNTLFVWATDNGSPVNVAGSNQPLRGGKGSNWEGGCRVPAFVSGGILPTRMHGQRLTGLAHVADFYNTFSALAGLPSGDPNNSNTTTSSSSSHMSGNRSSSSSISSSSSSANLDMPMPAPAPMDSLDLGPYWMGAAKASPRTEIIYDHRTPHTYGIRKHNYTTGALRVGDYKLIVGQPSGESQATWYGHFSPNASYKGKGNFATCELDRPCLFNLAVDPTEHVDLMRQSPVSAEARKQFAQLMARFKALETEYHPPPNIPLTDADDVSFCATVAENKGLIAPWVKQQYQQQQQRQQQ